jgi:Holliday junction resolvase RusA-like endonuclease
VVIDLPTPPSVNRTRRVDWAGETKRREWYRQADVMVLKQRVMSQKMTGPFQVRIVIPEKGRLDPDNYFKVLLDYLRRVELIPGDSRKYVKRIVMDLGEAPTGVRVELQAWTGAPG